MGRKTDHRGLGEIGKVLCRRHKGGGEVSAPADSQKRGEFLLWIRTGAAGKTLGGKGWRSDQMTCSESSGKSDSLQGRKKRFAWPEQGRGRSSSL